MGTRVDQFAITEFMRLLSKSIDDKIMRNGVTIMRSLSLLERELGI